VNVRRLATAAATIVVAIVCALSVPISQLPTIATVTTCCCPDPHYCHCPDHKPGQHDASMRPCHRQSHDFISPVLPVFTAPAVVALVRPERAIALVAAPLRTPHASPALRRPDAPS
jgi:hypothetical protein